MERNGKQENWLFVFKKKLFTSIRFQLGGFGPPSLLQVTLIRGKVACATMRKYAAKVDVDVATLRPFGQFL